MVIYLNDFRVKEITSILEEIKSKNINDLLIKSCDLEKVEFAIMVYYPELDRLDIKEFNPINEPMYPNPEAISKIVPKYRFIKMMNPNEEYNILMKQ